MAKRKRGRARRYLGRARRYVASQKMPLETGLTLLGCAMTPAKVGWDSPVKNVQFGNWDGLGYNLMSGFIGVAPGETPNLMAILNPFELNFARYSKMLILSGLISKVRKKFVKMNLSKIPLIGGMVS